jgi:hypothetical protein
MNSAKTVNNMTQQEKQLLLKDLCSRLPYGVICHYNCVIPIERRELRKANCIDVLKGIIPAPDGHINFMVGLDKVNALEGDIKPYLRPMSSMTEEEDKEWQLYKNNIACSCDENLNERINELHDWFNKKGFDYRGLIEKGIALKAHENMYK